MLRYSRLLLVLCSFQILVFSCNPIQPEQKPIKYAFLFIGDGMGVAQVNAAEAFQAAENHQKGFKHLVFTRFPHVGLASSYANNQFITESAAAGTALATGQKTNVSRISMDSTGTIPLKTIAEKCKGRGMKIGILSNVSINHATPASFYAHQPDRNNYFEIAVELANSSVDFFGGGGINKADGIIDGQEVNAIELAKKNGFTYIYSREDFDELRTANGKVVAVSPILNEDASMPYAIDLMENELTLADFTSKAIELLDNENGFFIMVEGGKIDWAGHDNDAATTLHEVISFDEAVSVAKKFYDLHPDETLIVVTADHETGGMSLGSSNMKYETNLAILAYQKISLDVIKKLEKEFKKELSGNKKEEFEKMMAVVSDNFGLGDTTKIKLTPADLLHLENAFMASMYLEKQQKEEVSFSQIVIELMSEKAGIGWTTYSHTGINVPIYAIGPGSEKFSGTIDNTDIPKLLEQLIGIKDGEINLIRQSLSN